MTAYSIYYIFVGKKCKNMNTLSTILWTVMRGSQDVSPFFQLHCVCVRRMFWLVVSSWSLAMPLGYEEEVNHSSEWKHVSANPYDQRSSLCGISICLGCCPLACLQIGPLVSPQKFQIKASRSPLTPPPSLVPSVWKRSIPAEKSKSTNMSVILNILKQSWYLMWCIHGSSIGNAWYHCWYRCQESGQSRALLLAEGDGLLSSSLSVLRHLCAHVHLGGEELQCQLEHDRNLAQSTLRSMWAFTRIHMHSLCVHVWSINTVRGPLWWVS